MAKRPAQLIVADSESNADLLWATQFFVPDSCIFIQKSRKKYLVLSDLEYARACKEAAVDQVFSYKELRGASRNQRKKTWTMTDYIVAALKTLNSSAVLVPADFSLKLAENLKRRRIRVTVGPEPFFPERTIKKKEEVQAIRQAIRATERAIGEAITVLRKSRIQKRRLVYRGRTLTSETLRQVINVALMEQGYVGKHTIVAGGLQAADPHCEGFGPLRPHEAIVMDVFPRSETTGYHADITRTVCRGRAPQKLRAMYHAVKKSQETAIQKIRHDVNGATVHATAARVLKECGFKTERRNGKLEGFIHSTGHGLGLEVHEHPRVSQLKNRLIAGQVVTVEPGLYYSDIGGVRIEDDILVKKRGCDVLSRMNKRFEIL